MVGNDVVDLRDPDADSRSYSPRFDERVFAPSESRAIAAAANPEVCRWLTWSAKEAAYKALRKSDPDAVFSARCFEVEISRTDSLHARVSGGDAPAGSADFEVRFFMGESAIHAVALQSGWNESSVIHGFERFETHSASAADPRAPGHAARRLACERVASALAGRAGDFEVRKEGRVPVLFESGRRVAGNLSLSHHGSWSAFAFECKPGSLDSIP